MKKKTERDKMAIFAPQMYSVLKELQDSASYWSEYDVPLGIVERINDVLEKVENLQKTYRKEYQKQYQKDYAASGKKKEAQSRFNYMRKVQLYERNPPNRFESRYYLPVPMNSFGCGLISDLNFVSLK